MSYCKKIWSYFKDSWEGEDGKFSYKRATILVFVIMMVKLALFRIQNKWEFYTFICFAVLYLLQTSIITASQLIVLLKYKLKLKEDEEEPENVSVSETNEN